MKTPSDEKLMKSFILQFTGWGRICDSLRNVNATTHWLFAPLRCRYPLESAFGEKDCSTR
jgi:hypothetical protein